MVDWDSQESAVRQVTAALSRRIEDGEFDQAGRLPRREKLAEEYGVSHWTITAATKRLREGHLVAYRPGKGVVLVKH